MHLGNRVYWKDQETKGNTNKKAPSFLTGLNWTLVTTKKLVSCCDNDQEIAAKGNDLEFTDQSTPQSINKSNINHKTLEIIR